MGTSTGSIVLRSSERFQPETAQHREIIKMERQLNQPDVFSVHHALMLPEVLVEIFEILAACSDLQTLKNVRLVCSEWKSCAYDAFKNHLSLVPTIIAENELDENEDRQKSLVNSAKYLKPLCGFPLKLRVNQWSPELERFLQEFSTEIVSFAICGSGNQFQGFPEGLESIKLPELDHVSFCASGFPNEEHFQEIGKALAIWKQLVISKRQSDRPNFKTCLLELEICENFGDEIGPSDAVFDIVDWNQVNRLVCTDRFFVKLLATTDNLQSLGTLEIECFLGEGKMLLDKVGNLTKLRLASGCQFQLTQMKNLKSLALEQGARVTSEQPLSILLPKLSEVSVEDTMHHCLSLQSLISEPIVFKNVSWLYLMLPWWNPAENAERADILFEAFPNITHLQLVWVDHDNNSIVVAPAIYSKLELLTSLVLTLGGADEPEVVQLVTGITMDAIPEDEHTWIDALEGNPHSICNLKHLKEFDLSLFRGNTPITAKSARFLFKAAFERMDTLEELTFHSMHFEDASCVTGWEELGRSITVFQPEHDDDDDVSDVDEEDELE